MKQPEICAVLTTDDPAAITAAEPFAGLFEVRIDLIGEGWRGLAERLTKPWIACSRRAAEGGTWRGSEADRIRQLETALDMGASIVDIEMATENLTEVMPVIRGKARCLLSHHDFTGTPPIDKLKEIVSQQIAAGADICKVVTTANQFQDNLAVLELIAAFPKAKIVAFAMGPLGMASRIMCPLLGGEFTYASTEQGRESAPGQVTVKELRKLYGMVVNEQ